MTKARFVLGKVKTRIPLLEEVLNEELGVSEDVLQATKQLIGVLKEVIINQKLDFTRTDSRDFSSTS
ncbi:MAG: hypothetical protein J6X18_02165 [Bacteroidales bacterium]|nr:hypothetical protein [Bacteroidales bacterium]